MTSKEQSPWHAAFPAPTRTAPLFAREDLLRQFTNHSDILKTGILLIDVRRTDYEGGTIRGSLNMPAQSFYMNMAPLYHLCRGVDRATINTVLFYCGSSNGRGPRCGGWFADYVAQRATQAGAAESLQVFTLEGGIKGWVAGGPTFTEFMDGYEPEHWVQWTHG